MWKSRCVGDLDASRATVLNIFSVSHISVFWQSGLCLRKTCGECFRAPRTLDAHMHFISVSFALWNWEINPHFWRVVRRRVYGWCCKDFEWSRWYTPLCIWQAGFKMSSGRCSAASGHSDNRTNGYLFLFAPIGFYLIVSVSKTPHPTLKLAVRRISGPLAQNTL